MHLESHVHLPIEMCSNNMMIVATGSSGAIVASSFLSIGGAPRFWKPACGSSMHVSCTRTFARTSRDGLENRDRVVSFFVNAMAAIKVGGQCEEDDDEAVSGGAEEEVDAGLVGVTLGQEFSHP
jgi:hypothetical protein